MTRDKPGPLVVFVHVPKTAGSTVNRHLKAWSRRGVAHAERYLAQPKKITRHLPKIDWISGHIALNKFENLLASNTDRELHFFGLMREPAWQVASQYNWQIEIFHRGRWFFNRHPPGIRAISQRIRDTDNTNPSAIIANLRADPGLFLNLQSRFLLGDDIDLSGPSFEERRRRYSVIATAPDPLIEQITGGSTLRTTHENASPYHFDETVFDSSALRSFLAQENGFDVRLYEQITAESKTTAL